MNVVFDDLRGAWQRLSPELQDAFARTVLAAAGMPAEVPPVPVADGPEWLTSASAARLIGVDALTIFRAIERAEIRTNFLHGRQRRLLKESVINYAFTHGMLAVANVVLPENSLATMTPRQQNMEAVKRKYGF